MAGHDFKTIGAGTVRVPWDHKGALTVTGGAMRWADGNIDPRDLLLGVAWQPIYKPALSLRVRPAISLPTGGLGQRVASTPLSSGSIDPALGIDLTAGGAWLGSAVIDARMPLIEGSDGIKQGTFARADARLARRVGASVLWSGLSAAGQGKSSEFSTDGFSEAAFISGIVIPPSERLAINGSVRVPFLWGRAPQRPYAVGIGLGVSGVIGSPPEDHEH